MESGPPAERATFELYSQPDFKFIQQIFQAHTILHENEAFIFLRLSFLFVGSEEMKQRLAFSFFCLLNTQIQAEVSHLLMSRRMSN